MRESMVFYRGWLDAIENLPPDVFKDAVLSILKNGLNEEDYERNGKKYSKEVGYGK